MLRRNIKLNYIFLFIIWMRLEVSIHFGHTYNRYHRSCGNVQRFLFLLKWFPRKGKVCIKKHFNHIGMLRPFCEFPITDSYQDHDFPGSTRILVNWYHSYIQGVWTILYGCYTVFWTLIHKFHSKQSCYRIL